MGGQNVWICLGKRGPRNHGQQMAQHFSRLVGAQYGRPERVDCFWKTKSPKPRVAMGATLFQASWDSVWEAKMVGYFQENKVPEITSSNGRSTFPG